MGIEPRALQDRPRLDTRQAYYYSVFQAIARSRAVGMAGALPIPASEILAYCSLYQIAELNERDRIFRYVTRLDETFLQVSAEKAKSKPGK